MNRMVRLVLPAILLLAALCPAGAQAFGLRPAAEGFAAVASKEGGAAATAAGSHPLAVRTEVHFREAPSGPSSLPLAEGDVKDLEIDLPPGLVEDPSAVGVCSQAEFQTPRSSPFESSAAGESCPDNSQIGVVAVESSYEGGETRSFGVFNLAPSPGSPSEIGFSPFGAPITLSPRVRQGEGEYGLTLVATNIPQLVSITGLTFDVWGTPWAAVHNGRRGNCLNEGEPAFPWAKCSVGPPAAEPPVAYLTLPTACEGPLQFAVRADSWGEPGQTVSAAATAPALEGCDQLSFAPQVAAFVSNPRASSATGFDFDLDVDNGGFLDPAGLAPSPVRRAVIALPAGMTINPSVGAGLLGCGSAQYAAETATSPPGAGCPNGSKIGDFTVDSPLVSEPLEGSLFLATPYENPFGSLLGVYLVAKDAERGILVKVAGKLDADAATGQLVATFEGLPQLPYTALRMHFREGQRSPLATPSACGTFATEMELSPWRSLGATVHASSPLVVGSGVGGGPCPSGISGFTPQAQAGSLNSNAGAYTPFYLHLTRTDSEQEITSYSATLPPGLTGKLAGIPFCSDAAIAAATASSGFAEAADPSCPAASEIGHTVVGYGLGPVLTYAPGGLYLAGPFHGSTFSIVAIDSATVGPFDLGTVVVRSAIDVNPQTAQVSIDSAGSDPIPHIIDGIPLHLRDIRIYISRQEFTLNPTSCNPFSVSSRLTGSGADFGDSADDTVATATSRYQAANCGSLGFKPALTLRLKGGTKRGAFPALRAEVKARPGDANIAAATVALPPSEFLAQAHIKTVCSRAQFAREACPAGSVYGVARAFTPLLSQPLEGHVYLRSSDNKLPDLVAALRGGGYGLAVDVDGRIDSVRGGLRGTFEGLPDAPITKFVMELYGGKRGLLNNSEDVCTAKRPADAVFTGQTGLTARSKVRLVDSRCGAKGKKHRKAKSKKVKHKKSHAKKGGKG
jgi:hypothetical protein